MRKNCEKKQIVEIYFPLKLLKKINFGPKNFVRLYKRSLNLSNFYLKKTRIYVDRGLYPVKFYGKTLDTRLKYGMYSFTRKPFAKPEKKAGNKKR